MNVSDIMTSNVSTVRPDDLLATASQLMLWSGGRHLPVIESERVVGVLSEGDLFRARAESGPRLRLVREAMTSPVLSICPSDALSVAAGRMSARKIGCLPVIEHDKLVGIITTTDVLDALERQGFEQDEAVETEDDDLLALELFSLRTLVARTGDNAASFLRKVRERAEHAYEELLHEAQRELTAANRRARVHRMHRRAQDGTSITGK
jgi:acetoin utilization protein AcuB